MTPETLLAVVFVTVGVLFLAMIRYAPRDNGCDGHHFEEYNKDNEYQIKYYPSSQMGGEWWIVKQRVEYKCAHEGCNQSMKKYDTIMKTENDLEAIGAIKGDTQ